MNPDREKSAQFLFTAALTGLALLSANERIAGFGVDLAASLAEKVLGHVCQRLLGEPWRLTHDLQQALRRAFFKAIKELEQDYHNTPQYSKLKRDNQEVAWQVLEYFKLLRQGAGNFFSTIFASDAETYLTEDEQVRELLYGDEEKIREAVARYLQELFYGREADELFVRRDPLYEGGEHLLDFLKPRLIDRWVFCFNEELKGDKPENRRAWIAFEQLFWEGLRRDLLDYLEKTYKLTEAAKPLLVDLCSRFDELLEYHALFGGRADAVAAIQQFIADPHGGYLFITGLSGYGKTALLAQWVRRYGAVYHFINQVYGTDDEDFFLRNLCQQLVACHKLGGRLPIPTTELQDLYPSLLRLPPPNGQTVVLVIDGLDEAGWEWTRRPNYFPSHLPYGVKVIFSAREVADRDWPSYLHLPRERVQQLELGAMKAEDVRSLLRVAGGTVAHLADNDAWIHEAQRVSNGDPFYLRLLVEDVRDGRIQPEAIEAQPVGLDEYLKSWWNQIDTEALADEVYDLLATLTAARGRLQRRDLQIMFRKLGLKWSGVLKKVYRFVIGNEREGYALCHPRFTEYVRQLAEPDIQRYTDILLAHCAKWSEHRSPYAMAHYARHLAEAGREMELWNLLAATQDWLKEQTRYDPSRRQYARDIEMAISLSEQRGIDCVPQVVAYNLLYATTVSQVTSVPSEVLALMTSLGQAEQALSFAELVANPWRQAEAYIEIGEELLSQGNIAECVEMLSLARASAMLIADPGDRGSALSKVAKALDRAGSKEIARNVLADALGSVAAETYGITEAVLDIADTAISIDDSGVLSQLSPVALDNKEAGSTSRGLFFCRFAVALGRGGRRDELVRFLELGPLWRISESKAFTLAWIAFGFTLVGDTETADGLFDQVRSMVEHKDDYYSRLTVGDKLEAAILAARAHLGDLIDPMDALMKATSLDPYEAEQARLDQQVLHEVVQAMINSGDLKRIWALAELPGLLQFRVELLSYYAKESARLGKPNDAEKALKRALQAIDEFTERYYADWPNRVKRLRLVVETTVQLGYGQCLEEALDVAERTKDYYGHSGDYYARAKALAVVARALAHLGNKQRAQEVLLSVLQLPESTRATPSEVRAWSRMMLALAGSGDARTAKQVAQKAMEGAEIVGDCNDVIEELAAVAQGFARIQDREGLGDLLSCVRRIKIGDYSRGKILIGIARAMSQIGDRLGLVDAITAAANICKDASEYCTDAASFETLVGIAHILAKAGDVDGLLRVAAAAQDLDSRTTVFGFTDVMGTVGLALVRMGELEQAGEILSRVPWKGILSTRGLHYEGVRFKHKLSVYNMAQALALTGQLDQALRLAEYITHQKYVERVNEPDREYLKADLDHPSRDDTYIAVASAWLSWAGARFDWEETLQVAIATVARIEENTHRFHGLIALSRSLVKAGALPQAHKVLDTALQVAETIQDKEQQSRAVIMAAETLVQIGETVQACEILAKAEYLARGIEDSEASMQVLCLLAQAMVQAGEFGRAQEIILAVIGTFESLESTQNIVESYVDYLTRFADLYVQMGEISQARELLSLAFEATDRKDESMKVIPLMKQARIHFRINDFEKAQQIVSSALEAFKCGRYNSATGSLGRMILEYIVEVLAKSTDGCSQETLISVLLEVFQSARSRGRDEVLEHIAVFSTVLSKLGVATETWECIQSVESLFNRKMLNESP